MSLTELKGLKLKLLLWVCGEGPVEECSTWWSEAEKVIIDTARKSSKHLAHLPRHCSEYPHLILECLGSSLGSAFNLCLLLTAP